MSHFVRSQRRSVSGVAFRTVFDGTPLRFVPDYGHQLILLGKSDIVKVGAERRIEAKNGSCNRRSPWFRYAGATTQPTGSLLTA